MTAHSILKNHVFDGVYQFDFGDECDVGINGEKAIRISEKCNTSKTAMAITVKAIMLNVFEIVFVLGMGSVILILASHKYFNDGWSSMWTGLQK